MLYVSLRGFFVPPSHFRLSWLFESLLGDSEETIDPSTEQANTMVLRSSKSSTNY
jgi:hypothetical protein